MSILETDDDRDTLQRLLADELYDQWYNSKVPLPGVGFVGPLEPPTDTGVVTPLPALKVGFVTQGVGPSNEPKSVLAFPRDTLERKFGGTPAIWTRVAAMLDAHCSRFGRPTATSAAAPAQVTAAGPNLSVNPPPADPLVDMAALATSTLTDMEQNRTTAGQTHWEGVPCPD